MKSHLVFKASVLALVILFISYSDATRCYACAGDRAHGITCRDEPWNVTTPPGESLCEGNCSIVRRDSVVPFQFNYITRGCHNHSDTIGCTTVNLMRTCVTSCSGDYCNVGSGIPKVVATTTVSTPSTSTPSSTTPSTRKPDPVPPGSFMCWSCSMSGAGSDTTCYDDPSRVTTANKVRCKPPRQCSVKIYRGSIRQDIHSFQRGCQPQTTPVNRCVKDFYGTTCQTFCANKDYCNSGNGVPPSSGTADRLSKPSQVFVCVIVMTLMWINE